MLWPCSAAAANVLSCILAVPVCCGPSMADESSSYIEVGPFSNSRRMGRGASLTVGVLMQRTPPCLGDSIWAPLRSPRPTYRTRRMRARKRGQRMPMGDTWEHRPQGGKYFGWNGKVLAARLQIGGYRMPMPGEW
jgi:hypothetical protein